MARFTLPTKRAAMVALLVSSIVLIAAPVIGSGQDDAADEAPQEPVVVDPSIQAVWDMTDGKVFSGEAKRSWAFGPEPVAAAYETYPQSPTGYRKMVYYDKGRLDLIDPQMPEGSIWHVAGALLVSEMLSGRIQLGEAEFVEREVPDIPLVGDNDQENPVTYADLALHSSFWTEEQADREPAHRIAQLALAELARTGEPVTDLLTPDGKVVNGAVTDHDVTYAAYDEILGHNIASPFVDWAAGFDVPALNLLGLPVTEPYWIEAEINDQPALVLIQAFERRTLTYNPANPEGWQVESGNVGLHYREWRGLERPERPDLARMAAEVPFGEHILKAARDHYIDPYMLVAVSLNASEGSNPFGQTAFGGHGLLGARPVEDEPELNLSDPAVNAEVGAQQFARHMFASWDWRTILANYYSNGNPNWDDPAMIGWIDAVLNSYADLETRFPPAGPKVDPVREHGKFVGEGRAAYYSPSYDVAWWERTIALHASWGNAIDGWQVDPNGFYCVHPDYLPGELLKLEANGRVLECTIGDMVATPHQISWRSKWAVEMSWDTFTALGLQANNFVRVSYLGEREILPTPTPEPTETPTPTNTAQPTETPAATNTPQPTETPTPTDTPVPSDTSPPTDTPASNNTPEATGTAVPNDTSEPSESPSTETQGVPETPSSEASPADTETSTPGG